MDSQTREYHALRALGKCSLYDLELAHELERLVTFLDLVHREFAQTFETKCFYAKTGEHASVDHGFAQIVEVHLLHRAREVTGHADRECVPCPGRIVDIFERIGAAAEIIV